MCGILAILKAQGDADALKGRADALSSRQKHRGPDHRGNCVQRLAGEIRVLCHERLAIVDLNNGAQPLYGPRREAALSVNGEIYNYRELRSEFPDYKFNTKSDCEVIIPLYLRDGDSFIRKLDGDYAFVVSCSASGSFFVGRDPMGVCPLFYGRDKTGALWFASEAKVLCDDCETFAEFPPGCYWSDKSGAIERWYSPLWYNENFHPLRALTPLELRAALEKSVTKRLMSDVPYGVLLSGGLDSSLVAAIMARQSKGAPLHTFSIGLEGSPDLAAARSVAEFIGSTHHELKFTVEDGITALSKLIWHIETYDITTVRASVPMFLMAQKIRETGIKMVLSGEGADEVFGGYLYFHHAPSAEEFHKETVRKLQLLSKYDCLRANKAPAAWSIEVRVPFLDRDFLDAAMTLDPHTKMITEGSAEDQTTRRRIEKFILRQAFEDKQQPYLPDSVLWRQKEQFSDGVGYSWIDGLKAHADRVVSDAEFKAAKQTFAYNTPTSKEAFLYRKLFHAHFPQKSAEAFVLGGPSVACSTAAAAEWNKKWKEMNEPSGRAVDDVHTAGSPVSATKG